MIIKIKNIYATLTDAEKKVADVILRENVSVAKKSVKEIAKEAEVAPSAVIRFCKKVGADGLSELKKSLIEELTKSSDMPEQVLPISKDDTIGEIFEKTFRFGAQALNDTLKMLDFDELEKIVKKIVAAKRVVFFAVGTSSVIAIDAHYRFLQMGISASYCSDILFMKVTAANLTKNDLAICISHSGQTKATIGAMQKAKESGATTVAISSFSGSILATESDHAIIAFADEYNYPVEAVSAGIAHMCIVDALMLAIAKSKYKQFPEHIAARNNALKEIRY